MNPNDPNANPVQEVPTFTPGISNGIPQPAPEPTPQPVDPTPAPVDPTPAPQPVETPQPTDPQPQPAVTPTPSPDYDAYLDSLINGAGATPDAIELPKPPTQEQLENDDQALNKFFGDLVDTAVKKAMTEGTKQSTIREAEATAWEETFVKYPEIKEDKKLRDMIHNVRMGAYQRGTSLSPTQAADELIGTLHAQYKRGVNDTNVTTSIRDSQPLGGGTQTPSPQGVNLAALHDGGDQAAVIELTKLIEANKI